LFHDCFRILACSEHATIPRFQAGPMRGAPAGTLFRGPAATEGPGTEATLECLLLTNSE